MSIWDTLIGKQKEAYEKSKEILADDIWGQNSMQGMASYEHKVVGITTTTNGTGLGQSLGSYPSEAIYTNYAQMWTERPLPTLTLSMLSGEAGQASIDELKDLWRARWGDKWVKREEIDGDFFEVAAVRLLSGNRLETHSLGDGITVYRLL